MEKDDVLIIGGGLGGLFAGAMLAREGVKVTVLEKNATCGGGRQSFKRFGQTFDTGMHVIGGMREGDNIRRICDWLGITDRIHIKDIDDSFTDELHFAQDGRVYRMASGRKGYVDALAEEFPSQRENLERYVDAMFAVVEELDLFYLRSSSKSPLMHCEDFLMSVNDFIAKYIDDEKLRLVLAAINPFYGGRKNMTPAFIHCLISVLYINGTSRFAGGSQLFADTLKDFINENGGEVILGDGAEKIFTSDRLITGVRSHSGRMFSAKWYISDIHPCTLFSLLDDPSALPRAYRNRLDELPNTYSVFTLNIALKPGMFRYINHSCYFMSRYDDIWEFDNPDAGWPLGFLYMTPPNLEQGEFATKMTVTAPMLWENVRRWEDSTRGHRPAEYVQWKKDCAEKLLDCMETIYPDFRSCIGDMDISSPLSIRDWYGVKEGSMCGFAKDCNNITASQVPVVTKVRNLLLTGQNCNVHGFCGVPLTSINTCDVILGRDKIIDDIHNFENGKTSGKGEGE